jgi:hypothetical protein
MFSIGVHIEIWGVHFIFGPRLLAPACSLFTRRKQKVEKLLEAEHNHKMYLTLNFRLKYILTMHLCV